MRLFYIDPVNPADLRCWFILETILIIINYPLFVGFIKLLIKAKVHINLKIIGAYLLTQYFPCLTVRLVIIGYQSEVFSGGESYEDNKLIIFCSWYRCYDICLILTILFWTSLEREFAFIFIQDYEKEPRLWIPISIVTIAAVVCGIASAFYTFELIPWYLTAFAGIGLTLLGTAMFFLNYWKTSLLYDQFKNHQISPHEYSLTIRYQLQENLWCGRMLRNIILTLVVVNTSTFLVFLPAVSDIGKEYLGVETVQFLDCLYNILIVVNGPTMAVGTLAKNDYLLGIIRNWWHGNEEKVEQEPAKVYFVQLQQQWDRPFTQAGRKNGKKSTGNKRIRFNES